MPLFKVGSYMHNKFYLLINSVHVNMGYLNLKYTSWPFGPANFSVVNILARSMFEAPRWMSLARFVENHYVRPSLMSIIQWKLFEIFDLKDWGSHNCDILAWILRTLLVANKVKRPYKSLTSFNGLPLRKSLVTELLWDSLEFPNTILQARTR